eukprot:1008678-Amphidinium_carterae.1
MEAASILRSLPTGGVAVASRERRPSFPIRSRGAGTCERLQGQGVVVTDCKGAAVVANKLKLGTRRPRGRHSRIERRILAAIGDIE